MPIGSFRSEGGNTVSRVLVSSTLSESCLAGLRRLGWEPLAIPPFASLPAPTRDHPDLLLAMLPQGELLLPREYYDANVSFFDALGLLLVPEEKSPGAVYPSDVLLDALAVRDTLYGKEDATSRLLRSYYPRLVGVRQGYARCSVALLSEKAAITADRGLADALRRDGLDVLTIEPGHISLPGYDYGFIGGAGGRLSDGTYVFFGDLSCHPDGERIAAFAKKYIRKAVSLAEGPLCDHGGLLCC